jgi:hypothetical protein
MWNSLRQPIFSIALGALAAFAAAPAMAGGVNWSIGINAPILPGVALGTVISSGHHRGFPAVAPLPQYAPVPVAYVPPPVYVEPAPVYSPPVAYAPAPVYLPAPVAYPRRVVVQRGPAWVGYGYGHGHYGHRPQNWHEPQAVHRQPQPQNWHQPRPSPGPVASWQGGRDHRRFD